jgi:hypothetical protein
MFSYMKADMALEDGYAIEYSVAVVDELRRLAVEGLTAFGHGGLEVGGVLYGVRSGNRLRIQASAQLASEHAHGPGFVLSGNDRAALIELMEPPPGLETVGWYRAHTRRGLDLDAADRELFDQFPPNEVSIGLVLKPTHWGLSRASFCVRVASGEILPPAPREFTIEPLGAPESAELRTCTIEAGSPSQAEPARKPEILPRTPRQFTIEPPKIPGPVPVESRTDSIEAVSPAQPQPSPKPEILPRAPREFTSEPAEIPAPVSAESRTGTVEAVSSPQAQPVGFPAPVSAELRTSTVTSIPLAQSGPSPEPESTRPVWVEDRGEAALVAAPELQLPPVVRPRRRVRLAVATAALLASVACAAFYFWPRPPRNLGLQAFAITPGQLRIEWDHRSLPVVEGASGILQIRDGESDITVPLSASQLTFSSITYTQRSSRVTVRLHIERRDQAAPAEESVEFVGRGEPPAAVRTAVVPPVTDGAAGEETAEPLRRAATPSPEPAAAGNAGSPPAADGIQTATRLKRAATDKKETSPAASIAPRRQFRMSLPQGRAPSPAEAVLPAAPAARELPAVQAALKDYLPETRPPAAPKPVTAPPPVTTPPLVTVPRPVTQAAPAARSGRLIWTGDLAKRAVLWIEGMHASRGSMTGSLSGVPAEFRVWPAELTNDGLLVYTRDSTLKGRQEPASKANGWNAMKFQLDAQRAKELVVVEAPSKENGFNRLILRNDARACPVIVVDWTAQ